MSDSVRRRRLFVPCEPDATGLAFSSSVAELMMVAPVEVRETARVELARGVFARDRVGSSHDCQHHFVNGPVGRGAEARGSETAPTSSRARCGCFCAVLSFALIISRLATFGARTLRSTNTSRHFSSSAIADVHPTCREQETPQADEAGPVPQCFAYLHGLPYARRNSM